MLKSDLICEVPRSTSLVQFVNYSLLTVCSSFTVGVMEEHDPALIHVMRAALEHTHKMANTTVPHYVTATNPESSHS